MGINLYSPRAVRLIEPGEVIDFPELTRRALERGERVRAFHADCYWTDIGSPREYERVIDEFPRMRHLLLPDEAPLPITSDT
jgi:NDP-sugar pyrophosphorylase family protein